LAPALVSLQDSRNSPTLPMPAAPPSAVHRIHVPCRACGAVNRLPVDRRRESPVCARCSAALLDGRLVTLDDATFASFASRLELPLLVQLWAPWSGQARAAASGLEAAAARLRGDVVVARVNANQGLNLMTSWGVQALPTLLLFDRGRELRRSAEPLADEALLRWLSGRAG
jgi:thioredoxin 2